MKILAVAAMAGALVLSGCASTGSVIADGDHVDFTYKPFPPDGSEPGTWPDVVNSQCLADPGTFGGALGPIVIGWLAKLFVGSLGKAVDKRIAEYSSLRTTQQFAGNFYEPTLWKPYKVKDQAGQEHIAGHTSCFVVKQVVCPKSSLAQDETQCRPDVTPRLLMVGQFLGEDEVLRVRPLSLQLRGIAARHSEAGQGSFAARINAKAVWQEAGVGKSQDFFDAPLLTTKFKPDAGLATVALKVPEWKDAPILPKLPKASTGGSKGVALITVSVAEAAEVPASLKAFKSFLGAKGDDLAGALKDAIENAID
jgi:hypothetical protein